MENGQLQFVNGGWVQHDEAAAHFVAMLDQTALGHAWLARELNVTPTVAWQIDPFGHSATQVCSHLLGSLPRDNGCPFRSHAGLDRPGESGATYGRHET